MNLTGNEVSQFPSRSLYVDAWRGGACVLMIFYHFCYDLNYLQIVSFDFFHHPFWLNLRTLIVALFVGIVGMSLHLATINGLRLQAFMKRLIILLGCAVLISIVSFILFHERFIFFGILHFIALASLIGLLFSRMFLFNLICGFLIIGFSHFQHSFFNQDILQWIGLMTYKPATEDYVPLVPWFGVVLLGMALGKYLHFGGHLHQPIQSVWGQRLATMGQHSLLIYMLHQPILLGGLWVLWKWHALLSI